MKKIRYMTFCFAGVVLLWSSSNQAAELVNKGNGTVFDKKTGLTWQQGEGGVKDWESAMSYCESKLALAGEKSGWRLPKRMELKSILDSYRQAPAIDLDYFPDAVSSSYWTSTTHVGHVEWAWYVGFKHGFVDYFDTSGQFHVRCVRGGKHKVSEATYLSSLPVPLDLYILLSDLFSE